MATQDNLTLARGMYEAFNKRAFDRAAALVADEFEWVNVPFGTSFRGPDGARQFLEGWATAMPDSHVDVKNLVAAGEYVLSELIFRGTHTAPLKAPGGTIQATGRTVDVPVCEVIHLKGGKIDSIRAYFDAATMMRQLGLLAGAVGATQAAYQPSP